MISVNLYQPGKINIDIHFPTEWNELHECELHYISKTLLDSGEETANKTRPLILKFIIANRCKKGKIKLPANWFSFLESENVVINALPLLDFIFEKNDLTNLPKEISIRLQKYFPSAFDEITCGEYEDCEIIVNQFSEAPDGEKLAHLAAILFRPKGKKYMTYHAADDTYLVYQSEKKIPRFLKLKPELLYAILIWYAGCRAQLPSYFPELYDGGKTNGKANPNIFTNSIHAGAGPKNGTRNQIRTTKLYEFLYECNQEAIKAKELIIDN